MYFNKGELKSCVSWYTKASALRMTAKMFFMEEQISRVRFSERQQKLVKVIMTEPQFFTFPTPSSLATSALGNGPTFAQFCSPDKLQHLFGLSRPMVRNFAFLPH